MYCMIVNEVDFDSILVLNQIMYLLRLETASIYIALLHF